MFRTKLVLLVAVAAALSLYLMPFGGARSIPAFAADCTSGNTGTLVIEILDHSINDHFPIAGTEVLVEPDPEDFELDDIVVDTAIEDANTSQDRESAVGKIRIEDACSTEGNESYTVSVWSLPGDYAECKIVAGDTTTLKPGDVQFLSVEVDCTGVGPTPTPTVTPTATVTPTIGSAATVQASASPFSVSCGGTSVINVQVRDAGGNPVQAGTAVSISASAGNLSPSSGFVTGSEGVVYTFFTGAGTTGGTTTITATAGSASGTTTVEEDCGGAAPAASSTVAPPPTVGAGGGSIIQPPNTGDAGLASGRDESGLVATGLAVFALAAFGGALALRRS